MRVLGRAMLVRRASDSLGRCSTIPPLETDDRKESDEHLRSERPNKAAIH